MMMSVAYTGGAVKYVLHSIPSQHAYNQYRTCIRPSRCRGIPQLPLDLLYVPPAAHDMKLTGQGSDQPSVPYWQLPSSTSSRPSSIGKSIISFHHERRTELMNVGRSTLTRILPMSTTPSKRLIPRHPNHSPPYNTVHCALSHLTMLIDPCIHILRLDLSRS